MKRIKNFFSWRVLSLALLCGILVATSCTKDFNQVNTNPTTVASPGPSELPFLFSKAQSTATQNMWNYQVSQNLFADQYAQYFGCRATYFASDRLFIVMNWVSAAFDPMYTDVVPQLQTIMTSYDPTSVGTDGLPDYTKFTTPEAAIASVLWVHAFHQVTDYWGPIPYLKAGVTATFTPYDAQDVIYDDFLKRLASASTILTANAGKNAFGSFDLIFGGDVNHWLKFCNTLRLRLALRISNVNASRAQTEAEAAVASGVMTVSPDDDALIQRNYVKGGDGNGLSIMSPWDEFRMSATMASALNGYSDPRIGIYYQPAFGTGTFRGLRNGLSVTDLGDPLHVPDNLSKPGPRWSSQLFNGVGNGTITSALGGGQGLSTPSNVMHAAEAYFLRAEGALKGWNMNGTAQALYQSGITASMNQWGITDATVINNYITSNATPIAPGDDFTIGGVAGTSPAVNSVPIAWSATPAVQYQQVAMQKWIALYPNGIEAWSDYRRQHTNLPLYNVMNSQNPDIPDPSVLYIRRIPFLAQELLRNASGVATGMTALGGPDKVTTKLWWDTNP